MARIQDAPSSALCGVSAARWKRSETKTLPTGRWMVVEGVWGVSVVVELNPHARTVGGAAVYVYVSVVVAASIEFAVVCDRVGARVGTWDAKQGW